MNDTASALVFAHIGDCHLREAGAENHRDLQAIIGQLASLAGQIDFVYLPGDNADNGRAEQYELLKAELARLPMPAHVITGDHDVEGGSLEAFYGTLGARELPFRVDHKSIRCLFLDISGPGSGGPDFRVGDTQTKWLLGELADAERSGARCIVFMHSYPADLKGDGETSTLAAAVARPEVLLVDMGHTHYNEIANDGKTIYAATRSTGQIEEGPVGFSLATIHGRTVSWRFRELAARGPIVLITAPADRRLTCADAADGVQAGTVALHVTVLGTKAIRRCEVQIDGREPSPLHAQADRRFTATLEGVAPGARIAVTAEDEDGLTGQEAIELAGPDGGARRVVADGSDADSIGAWPERGILGTQLGPNRNGHEW